MAQASANTSHVPGVKSIRMSDADNLAAYDKLPRAVRDWMKGALLQYNAASVLKAYRKWRRENRGRQLAVDVFVMQCAAQDARNAARNSTDPAFATGEALI